jgi:metal-sulfur cluster biosynthetic enzyme
MSMPIAQDDVLNALKQCYDPEIPVNIVDLEQLPGVRTANVPVVWNPPWTPERLSPEARKQLGIE